MRISRLLPQLLLCLCACSLAAQTVAIRNVRVIDGTGSRPIESATVVVVDGRVRAVGARAAVPQGATVIDGSGKTIIPGLINLHGHVGLVKGLVQAREHYTR